MPVSLSQRTILGDSVITRYTIAASEYNSRSENKTLIINPFVHIDNACRNTHNLYKQVRYCIRVLRMAATAGQ